MTVPHTHNLNSESSRISGPEYAEVPGIRGLIVNAAKKTSQQELCTQGMHWYSLPPLHVANRDAATTHGFWPREFDVWEQPVSPSIGGNGD